VPYVRSASVGLFIGVGSRDEENEISGISHFIEHMLFKGTERRTAHQIADEIESRGGHLNAWTDKEMTTYQARVLAEDTPLAVDILSDMLLHSALDADEMTREKSVVIEEIKMYEDSPEDKVHEVFEETLWRNHPLGRAIIGTEQTVSALTRDNLTNYLATRYVPNRIVVAATGNLEHAEIVELAGKALSLRPREFVAADHKGPKPSGKNKQLRKRDTEQVNFCMGSRGYSKQSPERYAASVVNNVLGGNMSSRLFQEIREKRGLAYSIGSYTRSYRDAGTFCVYGGTSPATYDQVIDLTRTETARVKSEGFTAEELTKAKTQVRGALVLGLESMSSRMNRYGESLLSHGRIIPIEEVLQMYDAVTNDSIRDIANFVFNDELMTLTAIGPFPRALRVAS
jgi:predicted Zn-dependent peptidase